MTTKAMNDLMMWATKMPENIQQKFSQFYQLNKYDALSDEMLGGRMDESIVTFQMMRWMIHKFETSMGLSLTFTEKEIYK